MAKEGEFVSFEDALKLLSIDAEKLQRLVSEGEIRAYREGDRMKFKRVEIERLALTDEFGEFVSFDDALELLSIDEATLKRLVSEGEIRAYRDGNQMKFKRAEIEKLALTGEFGEFVSSAEALELLSIDAAKLQRLVSEGEIRAFREGDRMKFKRVTLERLALTDEFLERKPGAIDPSGGKRADREVPPEDQHALAARLDALEAALVASEGQKPGMLRWLARPFRSGPDPELKVRLGRLEADLKVLAQTRTSTDASALDEVRASVQMLLSASETHTQRVNTLEEGHRSKAAADSEMVAIRAGLEALASSVDARLRALEGRERERAELPAELSRSQARLEAALRSPAAANEVKWRPPLTPPALVESLRRRGYYLSQGTADAIVLALTRSMLVVLQGAPGTGKSELARHLAAELSPARCADVAQVDADWQGRDAIGSLRPVRGHLGWQMGPITEAIVRSLEDNSVRWLILDEINRGPVDEYLAPLMGVLADRGGHLALNDVPLNGERVVRLPVPASFRILGTMNTLDEHLATIGAALADRMTLVTVTPPLATEETEIAIVRARESAGASGLDDGTSTDALVRLAASQVVERVNAIRALRLEPQGRSFHHCELGTRTVIRAVELLHERVRVLADPSPRHMAATIDVVLCEAVLPSLHRATDGELRTVQERVLTDTLFPRSHAELQRLVEARLSF